MLTYTHLMEKALTYVEVETLRVWLGTSKTLKIEIFSVLHHF